MRVTVDLDDEAAAHLIRIVEAGHATPGRAIAWALRIGDWALAVRQAGLTVWTRGDEEPARWQRLNLFRGLRETR